MNIYLISLTVTVYDQLEQVLVAAASEQDARDLVLIPFEKKNHDSYWGLKENWENNIKIELLGQLDKDSPYKEGDIIREFWAS